MKKYSFKATLLENDKRTGYKKDRIIYPKGFYYQKKNIILVGNTKQNDTIRLSLPIDSVLIEIF